MRTAFGNCSSNETSPILGVPRIWADVDLGASQARIEINSVNATPASRPSRDWINLCDSLCQGRAPLFRPPTVIRSCRIFSRSISMVSSGLAAAVATVGVMVPAAAAEGESLGLQERMWPQELSLSWSSFFQILPIQVLHSWHQMYFFFSLVTQPKHSGAGSPHSLERLA